MDIVIDASALIAVIVAEPERERILDLTARYALKIFDSIQLRHVAVDMGIALRPAGDGRRACSP